MCHKLLNQGPDVGQLQFFNMTSNAEYFYVACASQGLDVNLSGILAIFNKMILEYHQSVKQYQQVIYD